MNEPWKLPYLPEGYSYKVRWEPLTVALGQWRVSIRRGRGLFTWTVAEGWSPTGAPTMDGVQVAASNAIDSWGVRTVAESLEASFR